jgi:hypothetical protein
MASQNHLEFLEKRMNKLDVALKLIRLLNERRMIDSRIVADEFSVSLRTAQRYLLELSMLPCVIVDEKEHRYGLDPDYRLKEALLAQPERMASFRQTRREVGSDDVKLRHVFCLMCGTARHCFPDLALALESKGMSGNNRQKIDQIVALIKRKLKGKRCTCP